MTWSQPAYEAVAQLVGARTGLAFAPARHDSIEMGIRRAMARAGVTDIVHYPILLAADNDALDDLIVELTVGETYFFREPGQFRFIRHTVLPDILRRRGPEHGIRAWSAGCASGEEAYSLAIFFAQLGLGERAHLLATDISRAALARARQAVYSDWSLRGEGALVAHPYLKPAGNRYQLDERIRRRVAFEHLNLALDTYPSFATGTWGMDLILCRNVLIYFDANTVQAVARRLHEALAEGGWLITASSDPPLADRTPYEVVVADEGVFYRRRSTAHGPSFLEQTPWLVPRPQVSEPGPDLPSRVEAGEFWASGKRPSPEEVLASGGVDNQVLAQSTGQQAPGADLIDEAQNAFVRGDYARVVELTRGLLEDEADAAALHVRALANLEPTEAERACAAAAARHVLSVELHYLHAVLLLELDRDEEAARAARRVLYLDRSLAIAHFTLGTALRRLGDRAGARRAYRNARDLCAACPEDLVLPLTDGEHAGRLTQAAETQLTLLKDPTG